MRELIRIRRQRIEMIDVEYEELLASRLVYPHSRQPEFRNGDGRVSADDQPFVKKGQERAPLALFLLILHDALIHRTDW